MLVDHDDPPPDGEFAEVDAELLRTTVNAASPAEGVGYLRLYSSTPALHRRTLRASPPKPTSNNSACGRPTRPRTSSCLTTTRWRHPTARWSCPSSFIAAPTTSRPATAACGSAARLACRRVSHRTTPENDLLLIGGRTEVALSSVVQHLNDRIRFTDDILDVVFVEK